MTAPKTPRMKPAEKRRARQEAVAEEQQTRAPVSGKTPGQKRYLASIKSNTVTIAMGPAGTGKTFIASSYAAELIMVGSIKRIFLCRPAVEAGDEKIGFLPGDMQKKMAPWTAPIMAVLKMKLGGGKVDEMIRQGLIEVVPFAYMRGLNFDEAFVILDEAQNTTPLQMKLFTTRIGKDSKVVINGDVEQTDMKMSVTGLDAAIRIAKHREMAGVSVVTLKVEDIVRSEQTRQWVEGFNWFEGAGQLPLFN